MTDEPVENPAESMPEPAVPAWASELLAASKELTAAVREVLALARAAQPEKLLSPAQVGELLGCTASMVRALVKRGLLAGLECAHLGLRVRVSEVQRFCAGATEVDPSR